MRNGATIDATSSDRPVRGKFLEELDIMAKSKVKLTEEQRRRNAEILRRIEEEERRMFEDTRALQREWKSKSRRRRSRQRAEG